MPRPDAFGSDDDFDDTPSHFSRAADRAPPRRHIVGPFGGSHDWNFTLHQKLATRIQPSQWNTACGPGRTHGDILKIGMAQRAKGDGLLKSPPLIGTRIVAMALPGVMLPDRLDPFWVPGRVYDGQLEADPPFDKALRWARQDIAQAYLKALSEGHSNKLTFTAGRIGVYREPKFSGVMHLLNTIEVETITSRPPNAEAPTTYLHLSHDLSDTQLSDCIRNVWLLNSSVVVVVPASRDSP